MIRRMTLEDLPQVQEIDKQCFHTPSNRSNEALKAYINNGGQSSLVYEDCGRIAGYIFHHIMGNFAWFGTFGVHSDYRGKGIGKLLVDETMNIFENQFNIKNTGIVTMPDSSYNIGFYINNGFISRELALRLSKPIEPCTTSLNRTNKFSCELVSLDDEVGFETIIKNARIISDSLSEGLDMSPELHFIKDIGRGFGINVYENNKLIGFGVLRNKSIFDEESTSLHIRLLCIKSSVSSYNDALDCVINEASCYGQSIGMQNLNIDVNTCNNKICSYLIMKHGFTVDKPSLTLIKGDKHFYDKLNGLMLFRTVG